MGDNFYWDYGDGSLDTAFHGNHFYAQDTDYVVKLNGQFEQWIGGVCGDSTSDLVESLDLNASFTHSIADKLVSFTDKSTDALEYEWDFGDNSNTSGQKDPKHLYNSYGTFKVTLKIKNMGCLDSTTITINIVDYTGIEEERNLRSIELQPNPANNYLQLSREHMINELQWNIYSTQGALIRSGIAKGVKETLDVSSLENGVYFIQFNENGSLLTKRFVKL